MKSEAIILFDGVCNLCNGAVQFVLKRDHSKKFKFASLQSKTGRDFSAQLKSPPSPETIYLIENNRVYDRSTAALSIARALGAPWSLLYFFIIVPRPIRDSIYSWVARNRYRWFGKMDSCPLPDAKFPDWKDRFLN